MLAASSKGFYSGDSVFHGPGGHRKGTKDPCLCVWWCRGDTADQVLLCMILRFGCILGPCMHTHPAQARGGA